MNGVHDAGGMECYGPVVREEDEEFTRVVYRDRHRKRWAWWSVGLLMLHLVLPPLWLMAAARSQTPISREDRQ